MAEEDGGVKWEGGERRITMYGWHQARTSGLEGANNQRVVLCSGHIKELTKGR